MHNRFGLLFPVVCLLYGTLGAQWQLTTAPTGVNVYAFAASGSVALAACDTPGAVITGGALFRSSNNGTDWADATGGLTIPEVRALTIDGSVYYMGTFGEPYRSVGGVYRSTDEGVSWLPVNDGLTNRSILSLALAGTTLLAGTYEGGVFWSSDSGATWMQSSLDTSMVFELVVHGSIVFASSYSTPAARLLRSTDGGKTWSSHASITDLSSLATDGTTIVGARYDSVFISADDGNSWTGVDPGFPNPPIMDMVVRGHDVFALTNWGNIFHSGNLGTSWTQINDGMIDSVVHALGITDSFIFAGGESGSGVWRRALSEIITAADESESVIPERCALKQNYPNPFNPTTVITYQVPDNGLVRLSVFDLLGSEIAVLVDGEQARGAHLVTWDASAFPSGVYFYRLHAGQFIETKRLVLLR